MKNSGFPFLPVLGCRDAARAYAVGRGVATVAFLLALFTVYGHAANLSGTVATAAGEPIAGAEITILDRETNVARTILTAEDGSFALELLAPGVYTITVKKPGYADLIQAQVAVTSDAATVRLALRLISPPEQTVVRGAEELNPNLFYVKLDTNEITRDLDRRGADVQFFREFRSQENNFGGQYGQPLRRIEWAEARTVLRNFHGSLYEAHQNSALNARSFFTVGKLKSWRRNEFGGAAGGPILRDRLAFDFAVSRVRDTGYVNGNARVPLADERTPRSSDPATNAVIATLLTAYPDELPNLPHVSLRQVNTNAIRNIGSTAFSTHLDYRLNGADQLVLEQRFLDAQEEPFEFVVGQNPVTFLRPQSVHLTYSHPFSPQTLLQISQNFDRLSVFLDVTERYKNLLEPLGRDVVPEVSFGQDLTALGPGPSYPRRRVENRFHSSVDLRQTRGSHALAAGVLLSRLQTNDLQSDNNRGAFSFGRDFGRSTVENFLLGTPTSFTVAFGELYRGFRNWEFAYYLQDTIRVRPTFTLSVGLRHEIVTAPIEVNGLTEIPFPTDANNFSPQFGFAWNPGRGKTVVRGGYGVAFSSIFPVLYQRARFNPPAVQVITTDNPSLFDPLRDARLRISALNLISPDMVAPYSHLYNFGVERELPAWSWPPSRRLGPPNPHCGHPVSSALATSLGSVQSFYHRGGSVSS